MFTTSGDGPTNTGFGEYPPPVLQSSDTGCKNAKSIARLPAGLVFQSDKGYFALGRNAQIAYIGGDVDAYVDVPVTEAQTLPAENAVVFLTADERTLYTDYEHNAWSTWTNHAGISAVALGTDYYYLRSDGTVYRRSSSYSDDGTPVALIIDLPWYTLDGIQKYWRCHLATFLGNFASEHTIRVDVFINYRDYYEYTFTWDPEDGLNQGTWGGVDGDEFGDGDAFGVPTLAKPDSVYQFSHAPRTQKVQSIRFRLTAVLPESPGAGFELTALALTATLYGGTFRTAQGKHA
jgi:hypothetical protein